MSLSATAVDGPSAVPIRLLDRSSTPNNTLHSELNELRLVGEQQILIATDPILPGGPSGWEPMTQPLPLDILNRSDIPDAELPPLQANDHIDKNDGLEPTIDDDPTSYNLVEPATGEREEYSLEKRSQQLFSKEHLQIIFAEPGYLLKFTSFLAAHRPESVPRLIHYLDALKALRAINYSNAILEGLEPIEGLEFTKQTVTPTGNAELEARADAAFHVLVQEELPAYVTHHYLQIVSESIKSRVTGSLAPHLREASEGLAEVFCLTDPSRPDNPIVFASEEFNRTTQYGINYVLGRNCRFLQGPLTNPTSVRRFRENIQSGKSHQEVFLNYRRDGSPFMNLLMCSPLSDSRGVVRYFIGAQVDVSGLVKDCVEMESLSKLVEMQARGEQLPNMFKPSLEKEDPLRELAEMLNQGEMATIQRFGGMMHRETLGTQASHKENESILGNGLMPGQQQRLLIKDPDLMTPPLGFNSTASGRLGGIYQHYLLVRPYPSLRILFASPSQRVPGILQSPLLNKIGGSPRVRDELMAAFAEGRGVTAKVRWVSKSDEGGRNKWIHCTPLIGSSGVVGVWMVVIVDDEKSMFVSADGNGRKWRAPPPIVNGPTMGFPDDSSREASRNRETRDLDGRVSQLNKSSRRLGVVGGVNGLDSADSGTDGEVGSDNTSSRI